MGQGLRWTSKRFFWVLFIANTPLDAAVPDAKPSAGSSTTTESSKLSVEELAAEGAAAFKGEQFERAVDYYRKAAGISTRNDERAALEMNLGACFVELRQWGNAKQAFLKAAELLPKIASKARLSAALVAVELDQIAEAETLLAAARPIDDALSSREQDLIGRIAEKRREIGRKELLTWIATATKAISDGDWAAAETALVEARVLFSAAELPERIDVLQGLATAQLALNRPEAAKDTLVAALALSSRDPELYYTLGRTEEALGERTEARVAYRRALELGLKDPLADIARSSIDALDPLSPSEWYGSLSVTAGYDTNPRQSGAATETTLGSRGRGGSGYGLISVEVGRSQRVHEHVSLNLHYTGEGLGMLKRTVRELSLQNHGGFLGGQWSPSERWVLGLEIGPSVTLIGLNSVSPYTWDFMGSLNARYYASRVRTWRVAFEARRVTGAADWAFLSGTRLDAEVSHRWRLRPVDLRLGFRGRYLAIGTRTTSVDTSVITACLGVCDAANYEIPLSYTGGGPVASARLEIHPQLHLAWFGQIDGRRYHDESYIVGVEASRKRRVDLRVHLGTDLRWSLDRNEHFVIVPSYALLVSSSNVAQSSTDAEHLYDYDDRSFVQHFFELGVEANF